MLIRVLLLLTLLPAFASSAAATIVRVGVYENPPKLFLDKDGQPSGIQGDLLRAIAKAEGWQLRTVRCEWEACLTALKAGTIDLLPDVAHSDSREADLDFHQIPVLHSWSQFYRRPDVAVESILDLAGKRIAVLQDSVQQEYLATLLANFDISSEFVNISSFEQGFRLVAAGKADVIAVNRHFGDFYGKQYHLTATPLMFLPSRLFYASAKGRHPELLAAIDRHLLTWKNQPSSSYFKTLEHWGAHHPEPLIPPALRWMLAGLLLALVLASSFAYLLRKQVKKRTLELQLSESRMHTILNSVDALIFIKDRNLRYQYVNQKVCEQTGRNQEQILGHGDELLFDGETVAQLRERDRYVLETGKRLVTEESNHPRDGSHPRTYITAKIPLLAPDNTIYGLCGISTDITEQHQLIAEMHQLALYDQLTHLPNRRRLIEHLQQQLTGRHDATNLIALLFINLDNFKEFNDAHGYSIGDELLVQVANRLKEQVTGNDFIARLGSDEFAYICNCNTSDPAHARQHAIRIARHIMQGITGEEYRIDSLRYRASVCIGIAMLDHPQLTAESALKHADLALYEAKSIGRSHISFFEPDMEAVVAARAALELELRQAIEQRQFALYYQPQVDAAGTLLGYEALVRWLHPIRGMVPPNSFIGLAEVTGLIIPLGDWILHTACTQLSRWNRQPDTSHLVLSVNISARQLHHPEFVERLERTLQETGADPKRLELELTESQLVTDMEATLAKMQALKAHGIRLSIDDFGTGYSSLNYLKRFPIDQIKIDQTFVRDLVIDANDMFIVKAIIEMGHNLNFTILAEGVETEAQCEALQKLGCFRFQGYLFGRPAPI
jgi:diguanylate cyclase (GGDEF)-like protein/PAS domain S-box-containing protein